MTIQPDHEQDFKEFAAALVTRVNDEEPGTVLYALLADSTKPHTYVMLERYRDGDALARHLEVPYVAEAMGKLPDWLAKPAEAIQLSQVLPG